MKRINKKGFTLIELLAVIIIMGILLLVAIPSVTKYINDSRKKTYISSAKGYIDGVRLAVSSQELSLYDTDITYYVSYKCIDLEKGKGRSPFGDWDKAYVIVTTNGQTHTYYWTSKDVRNNGVEITQEKNLAPTSIKNLTSLTPNIGVGNRSKVMVLDDSTTCDPGAATTSNKGSSVPDEGGAIATGEVNNFDYTGSVQTINLSAGTYQLEVWGAQGGNDGSILGGYGAYAVSYVTLTSNSSLKLLVGQIGQQRTAGTGGSGGGGGTFIVDSSNLILAAAGGGGGARGPSYNHPGKPGSAITSGTTDSGGLGTPGTSGLGGSAQVDNWSAQGGAGFYGDGGTSGASTGTSIVAKSFINGGAGGSVTGSHRALGGYGGGGAGTWAGGGGGGYSGGAGGWSYGNDANGGGGGGSYYMGPGGNAIAGNASMPNPSGGTMTGKNGNGYARITRVG